MGDRTRERAGNAAYAIFRPGKFMQSKADQKEADRNRADAERFRQESMDLAKQLNWEPDYVSDLVGPYQRTQSPLARGFLESLLTGANPSMVSSTRQGADRLRAGAQAQFNDQFGGWDQLLERQRAAAEAQPWAPKGKFTAPAVVPLGGSVQGPQSVTGVGGGTNGGWGGVGQSVQVNPRLSALMGERDALRMTRGRG